MCDRFARNAWGEPLRCEIKSSFACIRVVSAKLSESSAISVGWERTDIFNCILDLLHIVLVDASTQVLKQTDEGVVKLCGPAKAQYMVQGGVDSRHTL
jgi:hypothetical protein